MANQGAWYKEAKDGSRIGQKQLRPKAKSGTA